MTQILTVAFLSMFLLVGQVLAADAPRIEVTVGDVHLSVPAPEGFYKISKISPSLFQRAKTFTPPTNELIEVFVSEEDIGRILKGEEPYFDNYFLLQTSRELQSQSLTESQFSIVRSTIRQQTESYLATMRKDANKLLEGSSDDVSKEIGMAMEIQIGEVVPLGIFLDTENVIGMAMLAKNEIAADGETYIQVLVAANSTLLVQGNVLFAYTYKVFDAQEDIELVRSQSTAWVKSILDSAVSQSASDPSNEPSAAKKSGLSRVVEGGVRGLATGALLALLLGVMSLIAKLFKRRKN